MNNEFKSRYLDLLRKHKNLMAEYEELLAGNEFDERYIAKAPFFPFYERRVYIERQCAFSQDSEKYMHMLTLPGQRLHGLKEIRDFTTNTESLIIVDPYIFSGSSENSDSITNEFKKSVRASGKEIKRIHFIYDSDPKNTTKVVRSSIVKMLKAESVQVTEVQSSILHDRIWISDRKMAITVGTSLNGIGGRLAFILQLPDEDLRELLKYLDENKLSRSQS